MNDDGAHDKIEIKCADVGHEIDKCFMQEVEYKGSEELISVDVSTMGRYQITITTPKRSIFSVHGLKRVRLSRDLSWKSATKLPNVALSRVSISAKTNPLAIRMGKTN